jgi:hypothetical protein
LTPVLNINSITNHLSQLTLESKALTITTGATTNVPAHKSITHPDDLMQQLFERHYPLRSLPDTLIRGVVRVYEREPSETLGKLQLLSRSQSSTISLDCFSGDIQALNLFAQLLRLCVQNNQLPTACHLVMQFINNASTAAQQSFWKICLYSARKAIFTILKDIGPEIR